MFKKLTLSVFLAFGLQAQAAEASGQANYSPEVPIQEVTEMADMPEDAGGFNGSVEFKYKNTNFTGDDAGMGNFSYRARAGWTGSVNQSVKWGVGFSSNIEQAFSGYELKGAWVEQAYAKYSPIENFWVKVGKSQWKTNYNYTGVLIDDDLYAEAVSAKFKAEVIDGTKVYVKVAAVNNKGNDEAQGGGHAKLNGPFKEGVLAVGKIGVSSDVGMAVVKGGVAVKYDGFAAGDDDKAYGSAYLNAGSDDVAGSGVGFGAFGVVGGNVDFDSWTYTGGVYVGSVNPEEANEYSAAVSYYNVESKSWNTGQMDTDYVAGGDGNGVAAKVQYNVWDNVSVVGKYSFAIEPAETHNVVGEVTFNF